MSAAARLRRTSLLVSLAVWLAGSAAAQSPDSVLARLEAPAYRTLRGSLRLEQSPAAVMGSVPSPEPARVTLIHVLLAPPDRYRIVVTAPIEQGDGMIQSDGVQTMMISSMLGQVAVGEARPLGAVTRRDLALTGAGGSLILPLLLGLRHPLTERLLDEGERSSGGTEEAGGAACDVVSLSLVRGGAPVRLRLAVDALGIARRAEMQMASGEAEGIRFREEFVNLALGGPVSDEDFATPIPPNMARVPALDPERVRTAQAASPER
ncbi:MAG: hypothetical protein HUU25_09885 [Candidatus Sumerlaeia bacterium]|nr:hypothetical protein [Candidatus Sumerlaeia bacterium]